MHSSRPLLKGRLQSSCLKKTVEDQGAQWWGYCRNLCTVQEMQPRSRSRSESRGSRDDFVSSGIREHLQWLRSKLEQRFEIKTTVIGHRQGEAKEGRVLNRKLRACKHGVKMLKLEDANPVSTPGEGPKKEREQEESQLLEGGKIIACRQLAARANRANYMAHDRPDTQFAVKDLCRWTAMPTVGAWKQLKRLGRYMKEDLG